MRDDTDGLQSTGQGSRSGAGPELSFKEFAADRLFKSWFPDTQPVGDDLAVWQEIAEQDAEVLIRALIDYLQDAGKLPH